MAIWWVTLLLTYFLCAVARTHSRQIVDTDGLTRYEPNKIMSFLPCFILVMVSGLRTGIGDTSMYRWAFYLIPDGFINNVLSLFTSSSQDKGFSFLQYVIKEFISDDSQVFIFIFSAITLTLIFITFYKHSGLLEFAVFMFIASGGYVTSMNGIRQYFVSAVIFIVFPMIYQKRWLPYFVIVLLCATCHASALIFIPCYFLVNRKAWGNFTKWLMIAILLMYVLYPVTISVFSLFLNNTQYSHYGDSLLGGEDGSNLIRTIIASIPIILSYFFKNKIAQKEKYFNIALHFSILNFAFMLLSSASSWIFARFCMYFSVYNVILLCWCIKYGFKEPNRRFVYFIALVMYGLYFFYEMHLTLSLAYSSEYITILS